MAILAWDEVGDRIYETGVDHGVLYIPNEEGVYNNGVAWNGLTTVTESPSGADPNKKYADNIAYLNLRAAEEFGGTIEAFTYPVEFEQFDGLASPTPGVVVGQQGRRSFGLSYRTLKGNDLEGNDYGYKIHMVYGCTVNPSERAYTTVNDSPEPIAFSWTLATLPVAVTDLKPTATLIVDSTDVDATALAALELILYGDTLVDPRLPTPDEVIALFSGTITEVTPGIPTYNNGTHTLTIPATTGVVYTNNGEVIAAGANVIAEDAHVVATPAEGYYFAAGIDDDWYFDYS